MLCGQSPHSVIVPFNMLFAFTLLLLVTVYEGRRLHHTKYCDTYSNGMGYSVKCGKCFCDKNNKPLCQRYISLDCDLATLRSKRFPNRCGSSNLGKSSLDGCNYIRCGNRKGGGASSTMMMCYAPGYNRCLSLKPGSRYTVGCRTCVCTAFGIPFCVNCVTKLPYYPNRKKSYCSTKRQNGNGFFDRDTCKMCICGRDGPICRRYSSYPEKWRLKCKPKYGAKLTNVCGQSSMGKVYYDGCNTCKCGSTSSWPKKCYTKAMCFRVGICASKSVGYTYNKNGRKCICTIKLLIPVKNEQVFQLLQYLIWKDILGHTALLDFMKQLMVSEASGNHGLNNCTADCGGGTR